ncbi:hypothetical protein, partial [Enterococcus faecalis]|uniref:hypothetical protein n=2 Tax=Enterococcus faecalis TaxID=1351 RepID=UPI0019552DF3
PLSFLNFKFSFYKTIVIFYNTNTYLKRLLHCHDLGKYCASLVGVFSFAYTHKKAPILGLGKR